VSFAVFWLLKAAIVLPVAAFVAYQNRHHTRSIWDLEEASPASSGETKTKD
jgi:hypothetical protein